jgi:glycerol uptake facilitator-like aquaporin
MYLLIQSTLSFLIQVPHYLVAQYLGAFAASGVVFLAYWDALVWLVELIFNTF